VAKKGAGKVLAGRGDAVIDLAKANLFP